jgi:hypothetical protein
MKNLLRTVALLVMAGSAWATGARPVLVIVHSDIGVKSQGPGLLVWGISAWANHYVNKQSAVRVASFNTALGGMDLLTEAGGAFGCVGAEESCDQAAFTDAEQFEAALAARADKAGVVVEITPELVADQMLMRAASYAVVLSEKSGSKDKKPKIEQGDTYLAVFNTRPPKEIAALKETNAAELEQYWLKGEPRRIVSDARHGLMELNALLTLLTREGGTPGKMPDAWKGLPKAKEFKASGRIVCSGMGGCPGIYVLKDNNDHVILVCCGNAAGWFDAAAAAKDSNLSMMAAMGMVGK